MKLPYYRALVGAVRANMQNGRAGACNTFYSAFDPEVNDLVRLKNQRTVEDKKIRGMDYTQMGNKFLARKAAKNEQIFLFNTFTAPDLYQAFFSGDENEFASLYEKYEQDPNFKKTYVSARDIVVTAMEESYETGRAYLAFMDEINRHTPYKDTIYSSNLCVAPETMLLTDRGHLPIASLVNQEVNVWNGQEYSSTTVVKTGEAQSLWTVALSDGKSLDCTPYHKWYVVDGYGQEPREVRTHELEIGQKLVKFDLPVIEGDLDLELPYMNGFFTGDGTSLPNGSAKLYLYGDKIGLHDRFEIPLNWRSNGDNRLETEVWGLRSKYFVPDHRYSVRSRLSWLAGWLDADGCIYRNGDNEAITATSVNFEFLKQVQYMLQTLGVHSKITAGRPAGYSRLPLNDGTGNYGDFYCQAVYRLLISSSDSQKLLHLGLINKLQRLHVQERSVQRAASQFVVVVDVVDRGRVDDTYCVSEPKRHMAVFNGILTGQCVEIVEPTEGYENIPDLYTAGPVGYIKFRDTDGIVWRKQAVEKVTFAGDIKPFRKYDAAQNLKPGDQIEMGMSTITVAEVLELKREPEVALCSLGGIVVTNVKNDEEYYQAMYYTLLMIDKCIHMSDYALPHVGYTAKSRLAAAVGMLDVAHYLARKGLKYSTPEGKRAIHELAETHCYFAIEASLQLAKELGNCPWSHRTKWTDGWLPIDTYNKNIDKFVDAPLKRNWEGLRFRVVDNGGIRNSALVAHMPTESSSKAAGVANSMYAVREKAMLKTDNGMTLSWAAPDSDLLDYELAWDIPTKDMIECYGVVQKFTDQTISADLYRRIVDDEKIPSTEMINDYIHMQRVGMKTRYYSNTYTGKDIDLVGQDVGCGAGGCTL